MLTLDACHLSFARILVPCEITHGVLGVNSDSKKTSGILLPNPFVIDFNLSVVAWTPLVSHWIPKSTYNSTSCTASRKTKCLVLLTSLANSRRRPRRFPLPPQIRLFLQDASTNKTLRWSTKRFPSLTSPLGLEHYHGRPNQASNTITAVVVAVALITTKQGCIASLLLPIAPQRRKSLSG
jgi:hypothetical protein